MFNRKPQAPEPKHSILKVIHKRRVTGRCVIYSLCSCGSTHQLLRDDHPSDVHTPALEADFPPIREWDCS